MTQDRKDAFLIVRIPQSLKDRLLKLANGKKLSVYIRTLLEKAEK